jgi:branched-subunit amino acid aminotransferase/4-amino-4-deoxychorismate lyase
LRLRRACVLLGIAAPAAAELKRLIRKACLAKGLADARVKLTVRPDGQVVLAARKYAPLPAEKYRRGFRAEIASFRQQPGAFLAQIKTTGRLNYELAFARAMARGLDEALILNRQGQLCEATRSNIFFAKGGRLFTPLLSCGCLPGITRRAVFALAEKSGIKVREGKFTLGDLRAADEAFLTNSLVGIMPLAEVQGKRIGQGQCRKITVILQKRYSSLLS